MQKYKPNFADRATEVIGSMTFIKWLGAVLIVYILWNTLLPVSLEFDPHPFILLNLMLSFVAAFQAPVIMMSQNRAAERDRQTARNTEETSMNTENMVQQVKELMEQQTIMMAQLKQMIEKVEEISEEILEDEQEELKRLGS